MSDERFSADAFRSPVLQALLDVIPGTLHIKDRELRYRVVNRYYADRWGLTTDDLIGRTATEVFGDEFDRAVEERDHQVLDTGTALPFYEVRFPIEGDEAITLWATKMPLFDAAGSASHILTLALDISPLKAMEQALDETERLRAATVQRALDAVLVVDQVGRILEFNLAAEDMFGWTRAQVMGKRVDEVIIPPELRHDHRAAMDQLAPGDLANRRGRRFQTSALRVDGAVFPVEIGIAEIILDDRSLFTAHIKDMTAERKLAEELDRQRDALNHSARLSAMGTLVATLSHELRNPLSVIAGQTVLLEETVPDPDTRARARRISNAVDRCTAIVERFLDTARKKPQCIEPLDLDSVVSSTAELLETLLRSADIRLHRHGDSNGMRVNGDRQQLGQVIMNLLMNAEQAMRNQSRSREIHVHIRPSGDGRRFELVVEDTGPGIDPQIRTDLFSPFVTSRVQGTGLGLAISRDIVTAHGGELRAEEAGGGGARFIIDLPVADRGTHATPSIRGQPPGDVPLVLAMDGDPGVLETLTEILASRGCRVLEASSVGAAISALEREPVRAVVCEFRLGDANGLDFYRTAVSRWPTLRNRFAIVTGEPLSPSVQEQLLIAGVPSVEKPFTPHSITALLSRLLGREETH